MKKGFTLMELLVVMLIIGILAAVAMPQYTRAVEKARAMEAVSLVKSFADAEKIYYMETGSSVKSIQDVENLVLDLGPLSISKAYPSVCKSFGSKYFDICVNGNVIWFERVENNKVYGYYISVYHEDSGVVRKRGPIYCCGRNTKGIDVCRSLGSKEEESVGGASGYKCGVIQNK